MKQILGTLLLVPGLALADCPAQPIDADRTALLLTDLMTADSPRSATRAASGLWALWLDAPDASAQDLLDAAIASRQRNDLAASEASLDALIAYCPDYAEGYNQRAFTRFLRSDFDGALTDIDVTLATHPYHFGALSGKAMTLMHQGRTKLAQDALRQAVKVHPYLRERGMLIPDADTKL
ncbi:MAG: hypothetical protein AAF281_00885 [Pseudomonadota bacterium]